MALGTRSFEHAHGVMITLDTDEGDVTVTESAIWDDGSTAKTHSFASPIAENDFLIVSGDFTVQSASAGTQSLVGIAFKNAAPQTGLKTIPDEVGVYSNVTRQVTVEIFGQFTREVTIASGGTAVAVAESVKPDDSIAHQWEGEGALNNNSYALSAGVAGETVVVLFGYTGAF